MTLRLVITVDTEPDNQWTMPKPGDGPQKLTFDNTRNLGPLMEFFRQLHTPVTWLTSYSVARDEASARVLRQAAAAGDEIGAHLHAWETPPFTPADAQAHPYIYEYEAAIRLEKLRTVTSTLSDVFGAQPASYRAGRWGIDDVEYENLAALGYSIDTSVVPGHSFRPSRGLARGGPDFAAYLTGGPAGPSRVGPLWEVPVSVTTLGLLGSAGAPCARVFSTRNDLLSRAGRKAMSVAGLCRMVWLRPLMHPRADLVHAARMLARRGAGLVNIMFHSSEAWQGTSPRSRTSQDVEHFYGDMSAIVRALRDESDLQGSTLRAAVASE